MSSDQRLDLIDGAIYADLFDCAVTFDELWRYCRRRVDRDELRSRLDDADVAAVLTARDDLYCLLGREELLALRPRRLERARTLQRRACRVARLLQHTPFVRGLALTGSVAAENADRTADVDLLVIVAERRLATVFTILGPVSRLLARKVFCPNQYVAQRHLALGRRTFYVARELAQALPLAGDADSLRSANPWAEALLPNAGPRPALTRPLPGGSRLQRLLEQPLRGRLGDRLESRLQRIALSRLAAHHRRWGRDIPDEARVAFETGVELRFHGLPGHDDVLERYEARRAEVARRPAG